MWPFRKPSAPTPIVESFGCYLWLHEKYPVCLAQEHLRQLLLDVGATATELFAFFAYPQGIIAQRRNALLGLIEAKMLEDDLVLVGRHWTLDFDSGLPEEAFKALLD